MSDTNANDYIQIVTSIGHMSGVRIYVRDHWLLYTDTYLDQQGKWIQRTSERGEPTGLEKKLGWKRIGLYI